VLAIAGAASAGQAQDASRPQLGAFGFDAAGMRRQVRPGDDFYGYANGGWQATAVIPPDRAEVSMFSWLADLSLQRTRVLLQASAARPGDRMGDLYASYLDETTIDRKGLTPLEPWLRAISWSADRRTLAGVAAQLQREGVTAFFRTPGPLDQPVSPDDKQPDREIFHLRQAGLGLPDRDYYLSEDPKLAQARRAYLVYATRLFSLAGLSNAGPRAQAMLRLEKGIASAHWSAEDSSDADKTYNRWTPADFVRRAPGYDWAAYLGGLGVTDQPTILVAQPSAVTAEARLWGDTPVAVLKDALRLRVLDAYAPYLSQPFVQAHFAFHGAVLTGATEPRPRWERGVALVSQQLRDDVGQAYVQTYFPPATEAAARGLVGDVLAAWRMRLEQNPWMAPETRRRALEKLAALQPEIGHPQHWRSYAGLTIRRDDLVGNIQRSFAVEYKHQLAKLKAPTDRDDWNMTPMRVDAEEDPVKNAIYVPAAILQPPYFDPAADAAVNYGAIGSFIGHEVSHSFDDQGRKYDASGRLVSWWTPGDVARFTALTGKLVQQYDAYEPLPGEHVQGRLVLGETMTDLGGITVGRLAYIIHLKGETAPTLDGFTPDQRFYLGWAQIWRAKVRDAQLRAQLHSDPHPPTPNRVDIVRNRADWYAAFGVQPGERLYLAPADRVQVW
jgi:putative endopeptidase